VSAFGLWLSFASSALLLHDFFTGQRTLTTATFFAASGNMKRTLKASMQGLLPKSLLDKLQKRKLFVRSYEEQQAQGEYFKLV